jgi:hypothetical protein
VGLLLHQHNGTHSGFATQLLIVGQGLCDEVALGLLPALLVEAGNKYAILGGFTLVCALLRLAALVRHHAGWLHHFSRFGLFLQTAGGGSTSGGIHRFRCRRSNFGRGFLEEEEWLVCYWQAGPTK